MSDQKEVEVSTTPRVSLNKDGSVTVVKQEDKQLQRVEDDVVPEAVEEEEVIEDEEEVMEEDVEEGEEGDEEHVINLPKATTSRAGGGNQQQIYIIQTSDGNVPLESAEVVVADDLAVYETVSALEQLSRGQVITTAEGGELIQVYEEVVLPDGTTSSSVMDQFVDVAEVEVGDGRSASPITIGETITLTSSGSHLVRGGSTSDREESPQSEFHICRICNQFIPLTEIAAHNQEHHGTDRKSVV